MNNNELIINVTADDFEEQVIKTSNTLPVLVDFWADWCQPCKLLAPILEQLATRLGDRVRITKVNTDIEQQLAGSFGIRSLPTVMLFSGGRPVNQFSGLVPLESIMQFLDPWLPRPSDTLRQRAEELFRQGEINQAIALLQQAVNEDPDNYRLHPLLAHLLVTNGQYHDAESIINRLPANIQQEENILISRALIAFGRIAEEVSDIAVLQQAVAEQPGNLEARYRLGACQAVAGDYEQAMDNLLAVIRADRTFRDDAARKALVNIFTILGNEGALVRKYRGLLSTALH